MRIMADRTSPPVYPPVLDALVCTNIDILGGGGRFLQVGPAVVSFPGSSAPRRIFGS